MLIFDGFYQQLQLLLTIDHCYFDRLPMARYAIKWIGSIVLFRSIEI
jgi:hypothetical protein